MIVLEILQLDWEDLEQRDELMCRLQSWRKLFSMEGANLKSFTN